MIPASVEQAGGNCAWIWKQMTSARNRDELDQVAIDIGSDLHEGEAYTKDKPLMEYLRAEFRRRWIALGNVPYSHGPDEVG